MPLQTVLVPTLKDVLYNEETGRCCLVTEDVNNNVFYFNAHPQYVQEYRNHIGRPLSIGFILHDQAHWTT